MYPISLVQTVKFLFIGESIQLFVQILILVWSKKILFQTTFTVWLVSHALIFELKILFSVHFILYALFYILNFFSLLQDYVLLFSLFVFPFNSSYFVV